MQLRVIIQSIPGIILISITPVFFKNILFYLFLKKTNLSNEILPIFSTMFHVKHCINGIFLPYSRIICINILNSFPILVYFFSCSIYNQNREVVPFSYVDMPQNIDRLKQGIYSDIPTGNIKISS